MLSISQPARQIQYETKRIDNVNAELERECERHTKADACFHEICCVSLFLCRAGHYEITLMTMHSDSRHTFVLVFFRRRRRRRWCPFNSAIHKMTGYIIKKYADNRLRHSQIEFV